MQYRPEEQCVALGDRPGKTVIDTPGMFDGKRLQGQIMDGMTAFQKRLDGTKQPFAQSAGFGSVVTCQNVCHDLPTSHRR